MEFQQALMNHKLAPEIEVVCLMASLRQHVLSSSIIKEVAALGGDLDDLVPPNVARALRRVYGFDA